MRKTLRQHSDASMLELAPVWLESQTARNETVLLDRFWPKAVTQASVCSDISRALSTSIPQ